MTSNASPAAMGTDGAGPVARPRKAARSTKPAGAVPDAGSSPTRSAHAPETAAPTSPYLPEAKKARAPQSAIMRPMASLAALVVSGTTHAPARSAPKKTSAYSIELSERAATLSPFATPEAASAEATRSTADAKSRHDTRRSPSMSAVRSPCVAAYLRTMAGRSSPSCQAMVGVPESIGPVRRTS